MGADQSPDSPLVQAYAELISLAVHEMRTPASVTAGYLRMLQHAGSSPLDSKQMKMVDEAAKSCARMVALFDELSDIGKLDDRRLTLASEPLDLFSLIDEVAGEMHEAEDRGVRLRVQGDSGPARLTGDARRLRSSLSAFCRAVLREQPTEGTVALDRHVRSDAARHRAWIVIAREQDLEAAAHEEQRPFEEKRGGMGLALPLAHRIITHHGGRVWSPFRHTKESGKRSAIALELPLT